MMVPVGGEASVNRSFHRRGVLLRQVKLSEVIPEPAVLKRTVSHYEWGIHLGFDEQGRYRVRTVDGRLVSFEMTTGRAVTGPR